MKKRKWYYIKDGNKEIISSDPVGLVYAIADLDVNDDATISWGNDLRSVITGFGCESCYVADFLCFTYRS